MQELLPVFLQPWADPIFGGAGALLIFVAGWVASKWANLLLARAFRRAEIDEALARFLASIGKYVVLAATVIVALGTVGIQTTGLVALLASAGLAVGLALQGSLSNFAAGVMILLFRPFTLGERITAAGETGSVTDIGLFATTLVTPENERIIIPNASVTSDSIKNYTVEGTRRGAIELGLAYGTDLDQALKIMLKVCEEEPLALADPAPAVVFTGFGASSLDFSVRAWARTADLFPMLHSARVALYKALDEAGIEIPFNQIVVHRAPGDAAN
jgi:small conductance mechanosensitive channel